MADKRVMWAVCVQRGSEWHLPPFAVCWSEERAQRLVALINKNPSASSMTIHEVEIIEP